QSFSARLGLVRGFDLAQVSRMTYPRPVNLSLYFLAEIAIAACDLAEVLGMAIGLQLLFGLPLIWGVSISVLDTILVLFLMNYGIKRIEAFIISLVAIIAVCFLFEMIFAHPHMAEVVKGFIPSLPNDTALYLAIGIIGATVMPHNLYLHSSLVQTRKYGKLTSDIKQAIRFNIFDSIIALNFAFLVNAAILILAGAAFYSQGYFHISEIQDAYKMLEPLIGSKFAPILFAVALIAAGQSSTITGTLAGQVVMEGYLNLRIQPWIRRLLTRLIAIIPAILTIYFLGEGATGNLLVLSQVILSLQLGFAIIPLIHFVSDKSKMQEFAISSIARIGGWLSAIIIVGLNAKLVYGTLHDWFNQGEPGFWHYLVLLITCLAAVLLVYVIIQPFINRFEKEKHLMHEALPLIEFRPKAVYKRIAVTVDFSKADNIAIGHALSHGGKEGEYLLVHILESAGAIVESEQIEDAESKIDKAHLDSYQERLTKEGYNISTQLGFGDPKKSIPAIVNEYKPDLLVMGAHGHRVLKDILFGTTLDAVRHKVKVPVLIVNE
ncbi:MAG TPA: Nramp family divalent metal transporter, partial [Saprospiraceae bacterium]|nr:Nramp family divalent metal transporter [Saprospiraceae bacterium]